MKVKISYTVDLDKIGQESYKLLLNSKVDTLSKQYDEILQSVFNDKIEQTLQQIHDFRISLAEIDLRLDDVQSILDGLMRARYGTVTQTEEDVSKE